MTGGTSGPPIAVVAHYGELYACLFWSPRAGGFSGSDVYSGRAPSLVSRDEPKCCLKGWPAGAVTADRLSRIHHWMGRAAHLPFVPKVISTQAGRTWVGHDGRLWELTTWMPGAADFRDRPTDARLANACRAVAELHGAWRPADPAVAPFPAVARRLAVLRDWRQTDPAPRTGPELADLVARAGRVLPAVAADAERRLAPWAGRPVPVQPCLCDVHHDHVLFTGDGVTGVIDYGAVKPDHPAVDLARLLGDLAGDDPDRLRAGLDAYHAAGGAADVTADLVRLLDTTGTVCAAANWLLRLAGGPPPADPAAVAARWGGLVRRLERGFVRDASEARP